LRLVKLADWTRMTLEIRSDGFAEIKLRTVEINQVFPPERERLDKLKSNLLSEAFATDQDCRHPQLSHLRFRRREASTKAQTWTQYLPLDLSIKPEMLVRTQTNKPKPVVGRTSFHQLKFRAGSRDDQRRRSLRWTTNPSIQTNVADFRRAWTFDLQDLLGSSSGRLLTDALGEQRV
jgi:hypothetical protein